MKRVSLYLVLLAAILALTPTACGGDDSSGLVVSSEGITRVDRMLTEMARSGTFTGSILIAQDGEIFLSKGYGLADRAQEIPNSPQTRFHLGSLTKPFTATAIVILQSQGKLNVKDSICDHIADCPADWRDITIHHLLTHTSGLSCERSNQLYETIETASIDPTTPSDPAYYLELAKELPLDARPGERYAYNNYEYMLLTYIIEQVSGLGYADFLDQAIFASLDMRNTGYEDSSSGVALCYPDGHTATAGRSVAPVISDGSGGLYSTTEDLFLLDQALYADQLLPQAELGLMFEPYVADTGDPLGFGYGYGWAVWEDRGRPVVFHTGGGPTFVTLFVRYPEDGLAEILLTNQGDIDLSVWVAISNELFGEPPPR
jgi:CubicO group peptidase (beta-lactamase class C family)